MFNYFIADKQTFNSQKPFPYFEKKDLWDNQILLNAEKEFVNFTKWDGQKKFTNTMWKNYCGTYKNFPDNVKKIIDLANSNTFVKWLETITGIDNLLIDETFMGAGMHETSDGGYLDMHADFNYNKDLNLYRRLNLLIYLNSNWQDSYEGFLEIEDKNRNFKKLIKPDINTTVLFVTNDDSIHGHPVPMKLPNEVTRKSIALYYYTKEKPETGHHGIRTGTSYYSDKKTSLIKNFINKFKKHFSK